MTNIFLDINEYVYIVYTIYNLTYQRPIAEETQLLGKCFGHEAPIETRLEFVAALHLEVAIVQSVGELTQSAQMYDCHKDARLI